jgi:transposase
MPLRRRRSHYQQLTELERGRVIGLREGGFSFRDIAERLGRNVSTVHACWSSGQMKVLLQEDRVPGGHVALLRGKTAVFGVRLCRIVLRLRQKFELQLVPQ